MLARWPLVGVVLALLLVAGARYWLEPTAVERVEPLVGATTLTGRVSNGIFIVRSHPGVRLVLRNYNGPEGTAELAGVVSLLDRARNPGALDYRAYQNGRGVGGEFRVTRVVQVHPSWSLRAYLAERIARGLTPEQAAVQHALVLGLRDDLGELRTAFTRAGLGHFLSLSGLHVSVLLIWLRRFLPFSTRIQVPVLLACLSVFLFLSGMSPSVLRAVWMGSVALLVEFFRLGRPVSGSTLVFAAALHLALQPRIVSDVGWQLSYLAVAGLLVVLPPLTRQAARLWPPTAGPKLVQMMRPFVVDSMIVSFAAQLPNMPITAHAFGFIPLFSLVSNVVATPFLLIALPLGLLALVAAPLGLSPFVNTVTAFPLQGLIAVTNVFATWPVLPWGAIGPLGFVSWYVALAAGLAAAYRSMSPTTATMIIASVACISLVLSGPARRPLEAWFLDVGQGDAILVRFADVNMLVDAGGSVFSDYDVGRNVVLRALRSLGVFRLDLAVVSHPHADHALGMLALLEEMPIARLALPPPDGGALDDLLRNTAQRYGVPVETMITGQRWEFPGVPQYAVTVLHPPVTGGSDENESSIVLSVDYHSESQLILTGDAGIVSERDIAFPPTRVYKVGHHGSRFSTAPETVQATQPELAVIQVGRNNYGHPNDGVVTLLQHAGATVLTTLESGAVHVVFHTPLLVQEMLAE